MELEKLIAEACGLSLEDAKDELNSARGYNYTESPSVNQ